MYISQTFTEHSILFNIPTETALPVSLAQFMNSNQTNPIMFYIFFPPCFVLSTKSYSIECCSHKLLCMSICCHTVWNRVVTIFTNINANNIHVRKLRLENDDALMRLLYILKWKVHIFPYLTGHSSSWHLIFFFLENYV